MTGSLSLGTTRSVSRPRDNEICLADGRRLAFCEYGSRDGNPVFFFHGWPGSRLDFAPNGAAASAVGVRVIAVDRPGIGRSDPLPGRTVVDWPEDVAALADSLGFDKFAVLGHSFGGAYARACAFVLPARVQCAGLVSCLGPVDDPAAKQGMPVPTRAALGAARRWPALARAMVRPMAHQAHAGKMVDQFIKSMAPADAEILKQPYVADAMSASLAECFRQGPGPPTWDGVAVARGEDIPLERIRTKVLIWHGEDDRNVPVVMAREQERRLPYVKARYYSGEGHLIFFSRIEEILSELVAPAT